MQSIFNTKCQSSEIFRNWIQFHGLDRDFFLLSKDITWKKEFAKEIPLWLTFKVIIFQIFFQQFSSKLSWSYPGIEPNCSQWSCFTVIVGRWNLCGAVGYEAAQCLIYQNQTRKLYLTVNMQSYLTTFLCKCTLDLVSINIIISTG